VYKRQKEREGRGKKERGGESEFFFILVGPQNNGFRKRW
jgi:hypothetical protein